MKHVLRKTIAVVLSMSLVLSCAGIALADAGTAQPKAQTQTIEKSAAPATATEQTQIATAQVAKLLSSGAATPQTAAGNFKLVKIKTGNEKEKDSDIAAVGYDQSEIKAQHPSYSNLNIVGRSTRVTIPAKGTIIMTAVVGKLWDNVAAKSIRFGLYKNASMTQPVGTEGSCAVNSGSDKVIVVPKGGTYYLGAYSTNSKASPTEFGNAVGATAYYINGADRTVTAGTWNAVGQVKPQVNYFKFKAKSTGYIKVTTRGGSTLDTVSLKNSTKKTLLCSAAKMGNAVFGVKAGNTYQIRVTPKYQKRDGWYQIRVSNYKVTEKSGSTRAKAVTISRGSKYAKKGTIIAGNSTSDWYKIKVTAKKAFRVVMKGETNNKMKMSLYNSKGKLIKSITMNGASHSGAYIRLTNYPKGTYYVKISRGTSQSSGHYSVFWNWNSVFK